MCVQAAAPSRETTSSLQTLDRVKNYKVVGKVSSYAKDFAEGSSIYNYIAPMSQKGVDKLAPYVPDVSQYVPNKYVQKVDSLGVTCLQRIEDVSTTSEEMLSARMKDATTLIQKFLPGKEVETKEGETTEKKAGLSTRLYSGVTGAVGSVSTTITKSVAPITTKIQDKVVTPITTKVTDTVTPITTSINSTLAPVTTRVSGAISTVKAAPQKVRKFREELTYTKVQEVAVASTSYGLNKVGQVLGATKNTTIAYIPERYRGSVEKAVAATEERVVDLYQRLPSRDEVRSLNREHVKNGLKVIASNALSVAKSPLSYVRGKKTTSSAPEAAPEASTETTFTAPAESNVEAVTIDDDEQPDAECEGEAPAPEVN